MASIRASMEGGGPYNPLKKGEAFTAISVTQRGGQAWREIRNYGRWESEVGNATERKCSRLVFHISGPTLDTFLEARIQEGGQTLVGLLSVSRRGKRN